MEGWFKIDYFYQSSRPPFFFLLQILHWVQTCKSSLSGMDTVTVFWALLSKYSVQLYYFIITLNVFIQFHFLISQFNTVPQPPNRSLLLSSVPLSNSSKHSPPKHSWKLTLNLCLRGLFSAFQFSTSGVFSLLQYIQKCVQLLGTHLRRSAKEVPLLCLFQVAAPVSCGVWSVVAVSV